MPQPHRIRFPGLSSHAIEHPADRAALTALRKVPGFDVVLKKVIGLVGERRLHVLYLASAVKVSDEQFPKLQRVYQECAEILDVKPVPELFVSQTPFVNAGAIGTDHPFIVLNSATLELLDEDELRFILGHELGHILSDHVLYKTMLVLLLRMAVLRFGIPLGWLVISAVLAALGEWDRKSELSADRFGLLCTQDPQASEGVFLKLAGGGRTAEMSREAFRRQAEEYKAGGDMLDSLYKLLNLLGQTHPFPVLRAAELASWVASGAYGKILGGEYEKRGAEKTASAAGDAAASARDYRDKAADSQDPVVSFLRDVGGKGKRLLKRVSRRLSGEDDEPGGGEGGGEGQDGAS
jgi:Zn-dependent protease with chaperone function